MNISVLGFYNKKNLGDESYKISIPLLFPEYKFKFSDDANNLSGCDILFIGGGDVLHEPILKQIIGWKVKKIALSVTVTESSCFDLIKKLDKVFVRDLKSLKVLRDHDIRGSYLPEFGLILFGNKDNGNKILRDKLSIRKGRVIPVIMNAHLISGSPDIFARDFINFHKVCYDFASVIDETDASFVFIPFSIKEPWNDLVPNYWLSSKCKWYNKNLIISTNEIQDTLDIFAASDLIISQRFHSTIFAISNKKPFIDITHHDKNLGFLETMGLTERSINYWRFDIDKMKNLINKPINLDSILQEQLNLLKKELNLVI